MYMKEERRQPEAGYFKILYPTNDNNDEEATKQQFLEVQQKIEDGHSVAESDYSIYLTNQMMYSEEDVKTKQEKPKESKMDRLEEIRQQRAQREKEREKDKDSENKYLSTTASRSTPTTTRTKKSSNNSSKYEQNEKRAQDISNNLENLLAQTENMLKKIDTGELDELAQSLGKPKDPDKLHVGYGYVSLDDSGISKILDPKDSPPSPTLSTHSFIESSLNEANQSHLMNILKRKAKKKKDKHEKSFYQEKHDKSFYQEKHEKSFYQEKRISKNKERYVSLDDSGNSKILDPEDRPPSPTLSTGIFNTAQSCIESSLNEANQSHLMKILKRKRQKKKEQHAASGLKSNEEVQMHLMTSVSKTRPILKKKEEKREMIIDDIIERKITPPKSISPRIKTEVIIDDDPLDEILNDEDAKNIISEDENSDPKKKNATQKSVHALSDRSLLEISERKCQEIYHSIQKDEDGFIDKISFLSAANTLGLNWDQQLSDEKFEELDLCGTGCLCFEEFKDGIIEDVVRFLKTEKPSVSARNQTKAEFIISTTSNIISDNVEVEEFTSPEETETSVTKDEVKAPSDNFKTHIGETRRTSTVQFDLVPHIRSITPNASKGRGYSFPKDEETIKVPNTPPKKVEKKKQIAIIKEEKEKTKIKPTQVDADGGDPDIPMTLNYLYHCTDDNHSITNLPMTGSLIKKGIELCNEIDNKISEKCFIAIGFLIQDQNENEKLNEIIKSVGSLADRFVAVERDVKLFHIHHNFFVLLLKAIDEKSNQRFEERLIKYITSRLRRDYGSVQMKAVSIIYELNERFGHFMERLIINLGPDPTWIPPEVQEQSSKLIFDIVSKRNMFSELVTEILGTEERKWEEEQVCNCIRILCQRGAYFNYVNEDGNDVAMYAARRGYNQIINELINSSPPINSKRQNLDGMSLLMNCLYFKRINEETIIKVIRNLDHNYDLKDARSRTVLIHCLNVDKFQLVKELINDGAHDMCSELIQACKIDDLNTLRSYFRQGLQMHVRLEENGATVGCCAAQEGALDILKFIARLKTKPGGDYQGATPLHYATMFGQEASVNSLLQSGAAVNAQDNNGETPLSCAVSQGSQTVVEMLLGFGADVNLSDKSKTTPFMKAAIYGQLQICKLLMAHDCDVDSKNVEGKDARSLASDHGHGEISSLISIVE